MVGTGAVVISVDNPNHDKLIALYYSTKADFERHEDWSDIEYDLAIWAAACEWNGDLCGFGPVSLANEANENWHSVHKEGNSPSQPTVGAIFVGSDFQVVESNSQGGLAAFAAAVGGVKAKYPGVGTIVRSGGVRIQIYSNDHLPAHAHVTGRGGEVRIGQNGKPIAGEPELSPRQKEIVQNNIRTIRENMRVAKVRFGIQKWGTDKR